MSIPQGKHLLVDGDILRYRCAFAAEKTHYLVGPIDGDFFTVENYKEAKEYQDEDDTHIWTRKEVQPVEFAFQAINTTLEGLVNLFNPSDVSIFLSSPSNFRNAVATTKPYKGNRDNVQKPKHYRDCGEFLLSRGAIVLDGLEADDALGIYASRDRDGTIIISIDKDLDQIAGHHYNWVNREYYKVGQRAADIFLHTQILTGDSTDNIPGLPGCGKISAASLLKGAKSTKDLHDIVKGAYLKHFEGDEVKASEYFKEQSELCFIWRNQPDSYSATYCGKA